MFIFPNIYMFIPVLPLVYITKNNNVVYYKIKKKYYSCNIYEPACEHFERKILGYIRGKFLWKKICY